jgi:hypothetical protein
VANAWFPASKKAQKAWLDDRCHQLKHISGAAESLYQEMLNVQQDAKELPQRLQEKLDSAVTCYKNHRHLMDYANYAAHHYPIGSGVTEAACKTLHSNAFVLQACVGNKWGLLVF